MRTWAMAWSRSPLKLEYQYQRRGYDCHHEDRADHPKPPTTLACLLEEELRIELVDKGWLVEQSHGCPVLAKDRVTTSGPR